MACSAYSEMMRSAHSTRETKMSVLPNFAPQLMRSLSETPRAREQAPQAKTGMCFATTLSRNSLSGGQPIGITASAAAFACAPNDPLWARETESCTGRTRIGGKPEMRPRRRNHVPARQMGK